MGNTRVTKLLADDASGVERAAELLLAGEIVAIPTETVYGLAALTERAGEINLLKGSPADKPITWLAGSFPDAPYEAAELFERHATVILPLRDGGTQGYRKPANSFALRLLAVLGMPLACTSANMSGGEPALDAGEVMNIFNGKIAAAVDGGRCEVGIPSAVVDFSVNPPKVLRFGSGLKNPNELTEFIN